jgi:hypothetical protein
MASRPFVRSLTGDATRLDQGRLENSSAGHHHAAADVEVAQHGRKVLRVRLHAKAGPSDSRRLGYGGGMTGLTASMFPLVVADWAMGPTKSSPHPAAL